jgi:hypothetical protein
MDLRFEVNMPVEPLGYRRNRFYRWGMLPEKIPGVMRMQDEAGPRRQRIEGGSDVRSDARDDWASNQGGGYSSDANNSRLPLRLHGGGRDTPAPATMSQHIGHLWASRVRLTGPGFAWPLTHMCGRVGERINQKQPLTIYCS